MLLSMSLIDRLSGVMDPEDIHCLGVLVDWADAHDYYPEDLIAPVVGDDARWVYRAYLSLTEGRSDQAYAAGVTAEAQLRILEAVLAALPSHGLCSRWDAAVAAAEGLPCAPWAVVADVAMLLGWCPSRDLLCYVMLHGTDGARRAARAVMMLRDGADPVEVWQGE